MANEKIDSEVPAGFDQRVGRERGEGWLAKAPGVVVQGRLLGRFEMKGQMNDDGTRRVYYQIQLHIDGVKANNKVEEKTEEVVLSKGQIVNVDEHTALEDLAPFTRDGGVYDVWFKYVSQDPIKGTNRKFWNMKGPILKTIRAATHRPTPVNREKSAPVNDEDVPF